MAPIHDQLVLARPTLTLPVRKYSSRCSSEDLDFYLSVYRRGFFLKDSFFEFTHGVLDEAVRKILARWGETDLTVDRWDDRRVHLITNLPRYRRLPPQHRTDNNQAVTLTTDNTGHKIVIDVHEFVEGQVKVKVVGEREVVVEGHTGGFSPSCHSFTRRFSLPHLTNMEAISSALSSDGILTITAPKTCSILPVPTRGLFFTDPFFKDSWQDFRDTVRGILSRWGVPWAGTDDLTATGASDMRDETQAVKSSQDDTSHKFVLDVHTFTNGGKITVKVTGERELVVEGHLEEETACKSSKKILRRFLLPVDVHTESVTAVMSADGVLTITAPKKSSELRVKEAVVPLNNEKEEKAAGVGGLAVPEVMVALDRHMSPPLTIQTDDSCDSLAGTLWTFSLDEESPAQEESSARRSCQRVSSDDQKTTADEVGYTVEHTEPQEISEI